jgi:hypothetical protein
MICRFGLLLTRLSLSPAILAEETFPKTTTGSRTWSMADGSIRKLRFVKFGVRRPVEGRGDAHCAK